MQTVIPLLGLTTVIGSAVGARQTEAAMWRGGLTAALGLIAIGIYYAIASVIYPNFATNPVLVAIVFLLAVEFSAPYVRLDRIQTAGVAARGLVLTVMTGLFLLATD